jgi:hypothetical protein
MKGIVKKNFQQDMLDSQEVCIPHENMLEIIHKLSPLLPQDICFSSKSSRNVNGCPKFILPAHLLIENRSCSIS